MSTGSFRLGLADCPHCQATGIEPGYDTLKCSFCEGGKKVELSKFNNYVGLEPKTGVKVKT